MRCRADDFELVNAQIRAQRIAHGHGWFDQSGVPIGCGDLDRSDFTRIKDLSKEGEWFLTIPESEAQKYVGRTLGLRDLIEHARFAVTRGSIYCVDPTTTLVMVEYYGLWFDVLNREGLRSLMVK